MMTQLMARDTHDLILENQVARLENSLLRFYSSEYSLGFTRIVFPEKNHLLTKDSLTDHNQSGQKKEIENIGLLDGVSGILLALISRHTDDHSWSMPFIIGGN